MTKANRIENELISSIENGEYLKGDQLPTEKELCLKYNVSKMTINKVFSRLSLLGYIKTQRGVGTFVTLERMNKELSKLTSFHEDLNKLGYEACTKLVSYQATSKDHHVVKQQLGLNDDEVIHIITRQRFANGKHFAIDVAYLNSRIIPIVDAAYLEGSLYEYLEQQLHIKIVYSTQKVSLTYPNDEICQLLDLNVGDACLLVEHTTYNDQDEAFEFVQTYYRSEKYYLESISYR
ncbi:MAG: GntR family transcriptional regulator [Bacilli bacterium]